MCHNSIKTFKYNENNDNKRLFEFMQKTKNNDDTVLD
jgi:hypothetical protein